MRLKPDLIFDLGMHHGYDSEYYLKKGFRVVAVEANPLLARKAAERLADWVRAGRLIVCDFGIAEDFGLLDFYVNNKKDDWSSFVPSYGMRGDDYSIEKVWCVPLTKLFEQYGTPYYMKVDIEGHDDVAIAALEKSGCRPRYVSTEVTVEKFPLRMDRMGYRSFKLVSQVWHGRVPPRDPPLEGELTTAPVTGFMSGPFGEESYGEWLDIESFRNELLLLRQRRLSEMLQHTKFGVPLDVMDVSWWDWHARLGY